MNGSLININDYDLDTSKQTLRSLQNCLTKIESKQLRISLNIVVDMAYHAICMNYCKVDALAHNENVKANMKLLNWMRHQIKYEENSK